MGTNDLKLENVPESYMHVSCCIMFVNEEKVTSMKRRRYINEELLKAESESDKKKMNEIRRTSVKTLLADLISVTLTLG